MGIRFILNSILLGAGLAMDAFSVSIVNGLHEPDMGRGPMCRIAGTFAFFQFAMPMIGWFLVRTAAQQFSAFEKAVPFIALFLLVFIGSKMILEAVRGEKDSGETASGSESRMDSPADIPAGAGGPDTWTLILQGIATSIDALSVGFTIERYGALMALYASLIIAVVTFVLCMMALRLGRHFGERLAGRASIVGGVILIAIGIEIFVTNLL